ncbi:MAG: glycosyltransferase family 9 protein [Acidobacteriota bacterium]
MKKAVFIGHNALGDTLCTTPVIRAFRGANPEVFIIYVVQNAGFCRVLDGNPDIDLVLYNEWMYLHGMTRFSQEWLHSLPLDLAETTLLYQFDIRQVCTTAEAFQEHISIGFSKLLGIPIESVRPVVTISPEEERLARCFTAMPYVVFSMHSIANPLLDNGQGRAKDWPPENWLCLAGQIRNWGDFDVIAVGSEKDTQTASPLIRNLYGLPIKIVAALLREAACVVTLENGIAHLCAAVDAPTVEIYSDIVPRAWANPAESTCCRVFFGNPREIGCAEIAAAVKSRCMS